MKKALFFIFLIIAIFVFSLWWFELVKRPSVLTSTSETAKNTNSIQLKSALLTPAVKTETNSPNETDTNSVAAKYKEYVAGKIDKAELAKAMILEGNAKNQDFYGKVIDQYGEPIVRVDITGNLEFDYGFNAPTKREVYKTQTDSVGLFQFTGLRGWQLGVTVKKDGYKMGERGEGYQTPMGGKSSPTDRVILTMWKLRGAEPMKYISFESRIPSDGTSATFDMVTGKQSLNGDLQVTLLRSPLEVQRSGQKFDWSIKVEILHGGIVAENDSYPYWAPENGYQSFFEFNVSSNDVPWHSTMTQGFYIKNSQGQYGQMQVSPYVSATPAGIKIDLWLNPSGSQNLEFDPAKQIQ